ncbi:ABC-type oligopeptide transport system,periplasmic component [Candidatus Competibacter denitrificans Run_A_D11]|uniref:ABC-type oligopeptide transport system,periplasmic component n=1 Tax=Candidatus Competibacter denitrificans Run_A_D11 TaxID=1400863 RepID=W6M8S1_9GAMM|nr:extracellular solute-binding protein [Candidatus Competibacter denitrificans]CDI03972.1 ABC-type oligopeptide transport system,periplasmic component [Candidatus Competibacter denitrificans Run_A_D11]HRC70546.1 extracellular solute-binding protein [Candidatus Competibacter denitrificans]
MMRAKYRFRRKVWPVLLGFICVLSINPAIGAPAHGIALHGQPKYGLDFKHFSYVNPDAPKGGEARFAAIGSFDTFNPFNIKGQAAAGIGQLFETLMTSSADEPFSEYGLIAESVDVADDRSSVTFKLRPQARFHDGSAITADDVLFSFDVLKTKGSPAYRLYYANVAKVEKLDERQVKFTFSAGENRELPLIVGQMSVLSKKYWESRDFTATTLDVPVGSGPYRIERFEPGRFIVFKRDENYWGKDLPVQRGLHNVDRLRYDYYRDVTVALEAFKAGSYDIRVENVAKQWATGYDFPALSKGLVKKETFAHQRPSGMQGFAYNLRRPLFQDPKIRQALAYAFDFEWSNRNLFHGQYTRARSYFDNSELAARGLPSPDELAVLEPLRKELPPEVFTTAYEPPSAKDDAELRSNFQKALQLLQEAGWVFRDRKLVNAKTGEPFRFELLIAEPTWERIALPFARNLERLGIEMAVRTVDSAQYENRERSFDFDMIVNVWGQSLSPGNEQREFWSSAAANQPGSRNLVGLKNSAVDQLVDSVVAAPDRTSLVTRVRALDRALQGNYLVIPHWHIPYDRIAFWDKFGYPTTVPMQGVQLESWWIDPKKEKVLGQQRSSQLEKTK